MGEILANKKVLNDPDLQAENTHWILIVVK